MSQPMSRELLTYVAAVAAKLNEIPESETWGGGSFYITDVSVRWSDGTSTEQRGRFVVNDFEGFDYVDDYKDLSRDGES